MSLGIRLKAASPSSGSYKVLSHRKRKLLRCLRRTLQKNINPGGHLIDACISRGVLTQPDAELIRSQDRNRQVRLMIRCIKRRPNSAFNGFLLALEETDQEHVVEALLGNEENLMNDYHRRILNESRDELVRNVNTQGHLLDALLSNGAITQEDEERIRAEGTNKWKSQVRILVDCLLRRPDSAFDGFIRGLLLTEQQHIANSLLENGLQVTVRLNLKRKRSEEESNESSESNESNESSAPDMDIRTTINRLINDGLSKIQEELSNRKRRKTDRTYTDGIEVECVEKLVGLLENFNRQIISAQMGSIVLTVVCSLREAVWDLTGLCSSVEFVEVCRSALIPKDLQAIIDVEVTVNESTAGGCVDNLDRYLPPPSSKLDGLTSFMPTEILHMVLHKVLSVRETGKPIQYEDIARVCMTWKTVLSNKKFQKSFKIFIESSIRPYIFSPLLLKTKVTPSSVKAKAIIGVCILRRDLYVARMETHLIEVYGIPDLSVTSDTDHSFQTSLNLSNVEMPFNMAASVPSDCLYLTDFARNVGCVWNVNPYGETLERKFADNVGRPIGINVSRDNYVIVVSEDPNTVYVFSNRAERVLTIPLPPDLEAPRQAICTEPGRFALIHGYLEPLNRVVEIDACGRVIRSYGSTLGAGREQIHWPAALVSDSRGRMLVGDRENRRIHLVDRNFRLKRHLVQLDVNSDARPRRLCLDDQNGVLYIGHTDPTIKVYRISNPGNLSSNEEEQKQLMSKGINCFRSLKETQESSKVTVQISEVKVTPGSETERQKFVPPSAGPYSEIQHLNEVPVALLQTVFLKAAAIEKNSRLRSTLVAVCRKWYNIVAVMHFRYRLVRFVKGHQDYIKRRATLDDSNSVSEMS